MDLSPYVEKLRRELLIAASAAGEEQLRAAEKLVAPLEAAVRLVLLDALSGAVAELSEQLTPGSVDLRLRQGRPSFVVDLPGSGEPAVEAPEQSSLLLQPADDGDDMVRINLRMSRSLKTLVEQASDRERLSTNAWLVRVAERGVQSGADRGSAGAARGQHVTGWVK